MVLWISVITIAPDSPVFPLPLKMKHSNMIYIALSTNKIFLLEKQCLCNSLTQVPIFLLLYLLRLPPNIGNLATFLCTHLRYLLTPLPQTSSPTTLFFSFREPVPRYLIFNLHFFFFFFTSGKSRVWYLLLVEECMMTQSSIRVKPRFFNDYSTL